MAVVTTRQLLDAGVHFGHQTRRWNPKMKRFIFTERNGIYIIDLQQSLSYIDTAYNFVKGVVAKGGQVLFVGTKKQAQEAISEQATRVGMPYVNQRWLGGMLTNFHTVGKRISRLKELEAMNLDDVAASGLTKKELLQLRRQRDKLAKDLGGIRDMGRTPQAVWVIDTNKEHLAVDEARKLRIPIVGILDTNCDPDSVDYPIPGNDDAIRSVGLLTRIIADAVADGLLERSRDAAGSEGEAVEPMPDWEREILAAESAQAEAAAEAPEKKAEKASAQKEAPAKKAEKAPTEEEAPAEKVEKASAQKEAPAEKAEKAPTEEEAPAEKVEEVPAKEEAPAKAEEPKTEEPKSE
ncbi:MAG: 30S ribosomal protein S2 [Propionibacterium sp.]|nr:MAG: 30S ribosomal protein S2 [Propionibacterium sp.]